MQVERDRETGVGRLTCISDTDSDSLMVIIAPVQCSLVLVVESGLHFKGWHMACKRK